MRTAAVSLPARSPTCGWVDERAAGNPESAAGRMLGPAAAVALGSPCLSGRPLTAAALSWSVGLRLSARGLTGHSGRRLCPAKPRFPLRIPEAGETARLVAEKAPSPAPLRRFIACPELARVVACRLGNGRSSRAVVLDCEPGEDRSRHCPASSSVSWA